MLNSWDIMKKAKMVEGKAAETDVESHIDVSFYKAALDEVIAEHGDEYPEWWEDRKKFFEEYNV